jgi:glyoxylase-like metal-dependent hydrolase (beta-lactamase superfamily II)
VCHTPGVTHPEPILTPLLGGITAIDTAMAGERELNAVYLFSGSEPCLVEAAPQADGPVVEAALRQLGLGPDDLAHIVVTHIHMDHAGGVGALLEVFPKAVVWVHERGAAHLADPTRLVASTARTYGAPRMHALFGGMRPSPTDRIRAVVDGDRIAMGERTLRVVHTPGHASHHVALFDDASGAVCTGEAIGSYLPWADAYRPALPPPEVDVELALASIEAIAVLRPSALLTSHFGVTPAVDEALDRSATLIGRWSDRVRDRLLEVPDADDGELAADLGRLAAEEFERDAGRPLEPELARYDPLGSIRMNAQGLARYWRKRWEAETALS